MSWLRSQKKLTLVLFLMAKIEKKCLEPLLPMMHSCRRCCCQSSSSILLKFLRFEETPISWHFILGDGFSLLIHSGNKSNSKYLLQNHTKSNNFFGKSKYKLQIWHLLVLHILNCSPQIISILQMSSLCSGYTLTSFTEF